MALDHRKVKTVTTVIDDIIDGDKPADTPDEERKELYVCPYDKDGKVCSASFDGKVKLNSHTMAVHKVTWDGKPVNPGGRKPKDAPPKDDKPTTTAKTEKTAAKKATRSVSPIITDGNRAQVYEQSLQTIGLIGHLAAGRWFTTADHGVWLNGAPGLANALADVGDENENIRRACDLILAGGGGGAYVKLIMASAMIAVPIAANHGWLPESAGQRFGAMIGVMAQPGTAQPASGTAPSDVAATQAAPSPNIPPGNPSEWTYEQWQEILFSVPNSPTAMQVMMDMAGPAAGALGVTIPDMPGTEPMNIPQEEHRGSVGTNGTDTEPEPVPATEA
jgi:hypothetical protein